ncbi:PAS domain S-box protein, partial [Xanthovirga aplysinae]|uniref:PAS domain S-box protein n=1 Tax=Xanthovirga aplysinae TaxID=2529853 RepID=UPI0012BD7258
LMINFEHLYEKFADAILIHEGNKVSFCNAAAVRFFKSKNAKQLIKSFPEDLSPLDQPDGVSSIERWGLILQQVIHDGGGRFEFYCQTLDGKQFWGEVTFSLIQEEGEASVFATCWKDISHLKDLEQNLRDFVQSSPDVTSRIDKNGKYLYISENIEKRTGISAKNFIGKTSLELAEFFSEPLAKKCYRAQMDVLKSGKEKRIEFMSPFKNKWVDYFILPQKNKKGEVESIITFSRDITAIKEFEKELRFKQEQFDFALDFAKLAYWELSLDSRTFLLTQQLANLLGYAPPKEPRILHLYDFIESRVLKEDQMRVQEEWGRIFNREVEKIFLEFRIKKGEEVRSLIASGIVVHLGEGKEDKMYGVTQDISHLKVKEEDLKVKQELQTLTLEFAQLAFWETTLPDNMLKVDFSLASLFGIPYPGKVFFMPLDEFVRKYMLEEDHETVWYNYGLLYYEKAEKASAQFRINKNGEIRQLKASGILVRDENGKAKMVSGVTQDFTDFKQTENELRDKQDLLTLTLDFARLAYWEVFLPKTVFRVDLPTSKIFGIPKTHLGSEMGVEEFFQKYFLEEDINKVWEDIGPLFSGKEDRASGEYRIKKGGTIRYIRVTAILIRDERGNPQKVSGLTQDISDVRIKEEELRMYKDKLEVLVEQRTAALARSQEYFKVAMQMAHIWRWQYDISAKEVAIDEEFVKIFNLSLDRKTEEGQVVIPWKTWVSLIYPEDLPAFLKNIRETDELKKGPFNDVMCRFMLPNGELMNVYFRRRPIFDPNTGKQIKRYGIVQDITNIRRMELERERLQRIIESTSDIIVMVDFERNPIYINPAGLNFYGLNSLKDFELLLEEEEKQNIAQLILQEGMEHALDKGLWNGENKLVNKYGETISVSQVVIAHKTSEGDIDCFSTIIRDMSEQKEIEKELLFKNKELDTFLYKTYHDLRGPVATLKGLEIVVRHDIKNQKALELFEMYD